MTTLRPAGHRLVALLAAGTPRASVTLTLLGLLGLFLGGGCSLFIGADDTQCNTPSDCEVAAGSAGWACVANVCQRLDDTTGPWRCLDDVEEQRYESGTGNIKVADEGTHKVIRDAEIKVCTYFDITCANPLSTASGPDGDDIYTFPRPENLNGYLEMHSAGRTPALARLNPYVEFDFIKKPDSAPLPMVAPELFKTIVAFVGETLDPEAGFVIGRIAACDEGDASGIKVELQPKEAEGQVFYLTDSNFPSLDATQTESNGSWGALNIKPGFIEAVARRVSDNAFIGKVSFLVRAGHMSAAAIGPSPQ